MCFPSLNSSFCFILFFLLLPFFSAFQWIANENIFCSSHSHDFTLPVARIVEGKSFVWEKVLFMIILSEAFAFFKTPRNFCKFQVLLHSSYQEWRFGDNLNPKERWKLFRFFNISHIVYYVTASCCTSSSDGVGHKNLIVHFGLYGFEARQSLAHSENESPLVTVTLDYYPVGF